MTMSTKINKLQLFIALDFILFGREKPKAKV